MLNFIYYPVSGILWFWHKVFGYVFGPGNGFAWALAVVFLVFTLRAVLFKPFVSQVRSMRKMQEFAPEIQKLKKKYGDDRQKMAVEMQKLQTEHGVNPLHVLRSFNRPFLSADANRQIGNYVFSAADVRSFLDAHVFGVPLSAYITEPADLLARYGDISRWHIAAVAIPLTIVAGILTHLTAKHSVARQNPAQIAANPQAAMMNRLMVYLFPRGVVAGGPFFPLAILLYWLSNNLWTLAQQRVVYQWIDAEDEEKKQAAIASRQSLAPRPGQKPSRPRKDAASGPVDLTDSDESDSTTGSAGSAGSGADDASRRSNIDSPDSGGSMAGSADSVAPSTNGQGSARVDRPAPPGMIQQRPRPRKKPNRKRR